jgi:putative tryptophan/tyrosine transport system substrate-binding protein
MRRREFISRFALAAALAPRLASAQETGRTYRLGFLLPTAPDAPYVVAFFDEVRLNGFVQRQNLAVVAGSFDMGGAPLAERATALLKTAPDLIVTGGPRATRAVQDATATVPIVAVSDDMIGEGLTRSLARPGGNTTGVSILAPELDGKRQDFLIEAVPGARRMAALADSHVTAPRQLQGLQDAMRTRDIELSVFAVSNAEEIAPAIDAAHAAGAAAVNVLASPLLFANSRSIIERTAALRLPAMYQWPETAEEGGFMGYGPRLTQVFRQVARLVVKILRSGKPADLPVEQPTRFELVINLKAAKAIGHEVPVGLVLRADKVIE